MNSTDVTAALKRVLSRNSEFQRKLARVFHEERLRPKTSAVDRDYVVWQSLQKLSERAGPVLEMMRAEPEDVETWHERYVSLAAEYIDAVYDSLSCKAEGAVGCDEVADPDGGPDLAEDLAELESEVEDYSEDDFMRTASAAPVMNPTQDGSGAVRTKMLLVLLFDVLSRMGAWPPGVDGVMTRVNLDANRQMTPQDRQRARMLAGKLSRVLAQLGLVGDVEAGALSRVLLLTVQSFPTEWSKPLEPALLKLNLHLLREMAPESRARQVQIASRLSGILDRLV